MTSPTAQTAGQADAASVTELCNDLAKRAGAASRALAGVSGEQRNAALHAIAEAIASAGDALKQANEKDLAAGREAGLAAAMLDRLTLTDARIAGMADAVRQIAAQADPLGRVMEGRVLPNGIRLQKVRVPIGVVLIIFESRPNVTCDAAALCLKSGNAVILRGGKEAKHSNAAIANCVRAGMEKAGLPAGASDAVQLVPTTDRAAVSELLKMEGRIDVCIPRGGESLIRAVVEQAHIPVIKHYTGNCHLYIDAACDEAMAVEIAVNAKTQRPGVCNATETIIVHREAADRGVLKQVCEALAGKGVEVRGDARTCCYYTEAKTAEEADWSAEYLDLVVAVRVVDGIECAIDHINRYGSKHTDAIVTTQVAAADRFVQAVDSANVFVNCSTRFSDGGQYGLGAEIGISTDKLHARGPMGADDLTTYKWVAYGNGQVRS
ncbi:glutamate-5-semialdehyde dehydrogenase [Phycisphaerales bacterium AB-hyl4]|uniref:Gamma-glutamyl phosphate reductase n=1 Tax=Natronomicrosphaera hydrolytica TaxID=3242702 RepID=A0ABV4U202_9BACT